MSRRHEWTEEEETVFEFEYAGWRKSPVGKLSPGFVEHMVVLGWPAAKVRAKCHQIRRRKAREVRAKKAAEAMAELAKRTGEAKTWQIRTYTHPEATDRFQAILDALARIEEALAALRKETKCWQVSE